MSKPTISRAGFDVLTGLHNLWDKRAAGVSPEVRELLSDLRNVMTNILEVEPDDAER